MSEARGRTVIGHGSSRRSDNPRRNVAQPAMDDVSPICAPADRTRRSRGSDNRPYTHCPKGLTPVHPEARTAGWLRLNRPTAPPGGRPAQSSWSTRTTGWGGTHRTTAARTAYAPGLRRIGRFGAHPGPPPKVRRMSHRPRRGAPWPILGAWPYHRTRHRPRIGQWHIAQIVRWGLQSPRCEEIRNGLW